MANSSRDLAVRLSVVDGGKVKAELADVGASGQKGLQQIERGAKPASDGLDRVTRSAEHLGRTAPAIGDLSHVMSGFVGGLAAGAVAQGIQVLARIPQLFGEMVAAGKEAEEAQRRLQAVLTATGSTAGFTAEQIIAFADAQERATLNTSESIQDAASILATFRSVSGDTFTRTISLAQDLSAVFGQDLKSSVTQLGKALEDPISGLTALRRVGVSFSDAQKEIISTLEESGQRFEAQQAVLAGVEQQLGGAAGAQQAGVTGATNRLSDAWGNLLEELGKTDGVTGGVQGAFNALAGGLERLTAQVSGEAASIEERYKRAQETLANLRKNREEHPILSRLGVPGTMALAESQVDALRGPANENLRIRLLTQEAEERQTQLAVERQQEELKTNAILEQRGELEKELAKLKAGSGSDTATRKAQIQAELDATRKKLEGARTPGTGGEVDQAVAQAEEIARRRTAIIEEQAAREQAAHSRTVASRQKSDDQRIKDDERMLQAAIAKEAKELDAVRKLEEEYAKLSLTQMANIDMVLQHQLEANAREIEDVAHRTAADVAATQQAEAEKAKLRETTLSAARQEALTARGAALDAQSRDPTLGEEARTAAMREGMETRIQLERDEALARLAALEQVGLAEEDSARARADIVSASEDRIRTIQAKTTQDFAKDFEGLNRIANSFTNTISGGLAEMVIAGREGFDSLTDAFQSFLDGVQKQLIQQGIQGLLGTAGGAGGGWNSILLPGCRCWSVRGS